MKTYTFFDLSDLRKLIKVCSYKLREKYVSFFIHEKYLSVGDIEAEEKFTLFINQPSHEIFFRDINTDIIEQISSKNEAIEKLKQEIYFLENISSRIKPCKDFKSAFETIIKS